MLNDLAILKTLSGMASHAARRHDVIAKNISNADTPGYVAKDVQSFADIYARANRENSDISHLAKTAQLVDAKGTATPDGNTVTLDEQILNSAQAVNDHDMALTVYRKTLDMMKMAIGKNL